MRNLNSLLLSALFLLLCCACGDEALFISNSEKNQDEHYSSDRIFYQEKDMNYVLQKTDEGKVLFSEKTPSKTLPKVGKVIAFPIDEEYPVGYYGKVKEITKRNGAFEVQLEPATIAELYPDTVLYYKGPVYALNSSRAGDDIIFHIDLTLGLINITGEYTMVSPEVEYKVETSNGKEIGRTFRIISRVTTKTEFSFIGRDIDWESEKPLASVYLVGGSFSKYLGLGVKADFNGRVVGNVDIDVSLTHTMQGQLDAGFSVGEHVADSTGQIINDFDVAINDLEFSKFKKAKGEIGFGISLKAYTDGNLLGWKFSTDDNLFLRVAALANFKSDYDYANFNYNETKNEVETGLKLIVDYKAGITMKDPNNNKIFVGYSDSAQWVIPWDKFLLWPKMDVSRNVYYGESAIVDASLTNNEAILSFCNKAVVWYEKDTDKICGYEYVSFDEYWSTIVSITGLNPQKDYLVYPAIEIIENEFLRIGEPVWFGPGELDIPGWDWILP